MVGPLVLCCVVLPQTISAVRKEKVPHVTGLAVLIWDLHPTWTHLQVRDRIYNTVRPLAALAGITATGGIINAYEAVLEPLAAPSAPPAPTYQKVVASAETPGGGSVDGQPGPTLKFLTPT